MNTSKIPFLDEKGDIIGIIGISMDVTERKRADHLIQELVHRLELEKDYAQKSALIDGLTGIANRLHFDDTLRREFYRLKRFKIPLSLIMLDIDHFKEFNDRYGHLAGDDCLRLVATAFRTALGRTSDFVARYGGEEFVVILDTSKNGAIIVAERLRKAVEALAIPHDSSDIAAHVTVSLGAAIVYPHKMEVPEKLIELADQALYRAKGSGRNRFEVAVDATGSYNTAEEEKLDYIRLVWHASDECGNAVIDDQHKKLFDTPNKLLSAIIGGCPRNECTVLISRFFEETVGHFRVEEDILVSRDYPLTEEHRQAHADLVAKATELAEKYANDQLTINELFSFLAVAVVSQHIVHRRQKIFPLYLTPLKGVLGSVPP